MNLATGHEVLHEAVSTEAAYFVEVDLEAACLHRRPQSADQLRLEAESLVEGLLLEQVYIVLEEVSAPVFLAVPVVGHQALLWLNLSL